jgi:hypothetical protein
VKWLVSGKRVIVLAPSSPAVEVLRAQGFTNGETLQQFQVNKDLQEQVKGQVLWVDEAVALLRWVGSAAKESTVDFPVDNCVACATLEFPTLRL